MHSYENASFQDQNAMAYRFEYNFFWKSKNISNLHIALIHCLKYEKGSTSGYQKN